MKASELRIGNYIFDRYEIIKIDKYHFALAESFYTEDFTPIPLTEEWLLKFGFNKVGSNYENRLIILHTNNKTGTFDFLLNEPHSNKLIVRVIESVHQLQNLYFALTNEELTYEQQK